MKVLLSTLVVAAAITMAAPPAHATGLKTPVFSPASSPQVQRILVQIRQQQISQAQRAAVEAATRKARAKRSKSKAGGQK